MIPSSGTPSYLSDLLVPYSPSEQLHSAAAILLTVYRMKLAFSSRAFLVSVSAVWNSLDNTLLTTHKPFWFLNDMFQAAFNITLSESLICALIPFWLRVFSAFSALTLLLGWHEGHLACKNWLVGCWCGYLSGARCRLTYGPADTTATHCLLLQ